MSRKWENKSRGQPRYYQDTNGILQALDTDSSTSIEDETDD